MDSIKMVFRNIEKCWFAHTPVSGITKPFNLHEVWCGIWKMSLSRCLQSTPEKQKKRKSKNFHARSWIPTHDSSVRTAEGFTRLRHTDNCAQQRAETRAMQC